MVAKLSGPEKRLSSAKPRRLLPFLHASLPCVGHERHAAVLRVVQGPRGEGRGAGAERQAGGTRSRPETGVPRISKVVVRSICPPVIQGASLPHVLWGRWQPRAAAPAAGNKTTNSILQ